MRALLAVLLLLPAAVAAFDVPPGYELQKLDTTEGSIAKPKGWYYSHFGKNKSLHWIVAKEDPKAGPYKTGLRIQFVPEATRATGGIPPRQFVERFIAQKRQSAEVKRTCPPADTGGFMRRCLETVEGPYRILYSLFWSDEKDAIVVTVFGAPTGEWEQAHRIAERMNEFELIGAGFWKNHRDAKK
jgi:hypothetical protein